MDRLFGNSRCSVASANDQDVPRSADAVCDRAFQAEALSWLVRRMLRLLMGDSSISVRMAMRSSVAETTGKRITSAQPKASRHCRELDLCSAQEFLEPRHKQKAGRASSSHARLSRSSINEPESVEKHPFPEG